MRYVIFFMQIFSKKILLGNFLLYFSKNSKVLKYGLMEKCRWQLTQSSSYKGCVLHLLSLSFQKKFHIKKNVQTLKFIMLVQELKIMTICASIQMTLCYKQAAHDNSQNLLQVFLQDLRNLISENQKNRKGHIGLKLIRKPFSLHSNFSSQKILILTAFKAYLLVHCIFKIFSRL